MSNPDLNVFEEPEKYTAIEAGGQVYLYIPDSTDKGIKHKVIPVGIAKSTLIWSDPPEEEKRIDILDQIWSLGNKENKGTYTLETKFNFLTKERHKPVLSAEVHKLQSGVRNSVQDTVITIDEIKF